METSKKTTSNASSLECIDCLVSGPDKEPFPHKPDCHCFKMNAEVFMCHPAPFLVDSSGAHFPNWAGSYMRVRLMKEKDGKH